MGKKKFHSARVKLNSVAKHGASSRPSVEDALSTEFRLRGRVQTGAPAVGGSLVWPQTAIENSLVQEDAG